MNSKVYIETFGCQMNVADTERAVTGLRKAGYETTTLPDEADVILLNTCSVRERAERKTFRRVSQLRKAFVNHLPSNVLIETMQFNNKVELLQSWTNEHAAVLNVLQTKLSSGKRVRFADAIQAAADQLKDRPEGKRHVVFITDGVDTPGGRIDRAQAIQRLARVRATGPH